MGPPEPVSQMNNLFATGALDPSWQMNLLSPGQDSMTGPEKLMAETAINNYPHDPVRHLFNRIREKKVKNNMKKHASIISYLNGVNKKASLDNNWIVKDPKTKKWDYTSLADEKEMPQYGIYPSWFRTRVFDDFVFDALDQGLYGTERFKGKWADQDKNLIEKDFSDYGPNFTPNKACKQIYKQLKALTPEKIKQLRDENAKYYSYYPSEDEIKHFIDYFGRHAAAGHSMISE